MLTTYEAEAEEVTSDAIVQTVLARIESPRARATPPAHDRPRPRTRRAPVAPAVMGRAKAELVSRGVIPFIADNRIHVVPPCVVTADEVAEALAAYDAVLTLLDEEL